LNNVLCNVTLNWFQFIVLIYYTCLRF
jgi:hypothetical protein